MKAVILAAGVGSRLRPMTTKKPKCLVKVAGKPILEYQIEAYAAAGIRNIVIVVGYEAEKIKEYCRYIKTVDIKLIDNPDYEVTNNMYSLYLARHEAGGGDFLLSNGDVVFDAEIVKKAVEDERKDLIVADRGSYNEESMKIVVGSSGYIKDISKQIPPGDSYGNSIDLYKFSAASSEIFFEYMRKIIEDEENLKDWTEIALQRLLQEGGLPMRPFDISGRRWVEIDNYEDLALAEKHFSGFDVSLSGKKLFFVDFDGTIYVGDHLCEGAREFLQHLKRDGIEYYFVSNNSSRAKEDYVEKLAGLGIEIAKEEVVLSTDGLLQYLLERKVTDVYLVGTASMERSFAAAGINTRSQQPEYVVLGYDTELTYEKLKVAALHMSAGVDLLATHCDVVCPTPEGPIPDIGSMLALLEKATGKKPVKIFGKPNREMVKHIIAKHGAAESEIAVVGDRLYTDMKLAREVGCAFICVLSGETRRENIEDLEDVPDLIVKNVGELA